MQFLGYGNGEDGVAPSDFNNANGVGYGSCTGTAGNTSIYVTDVAYAWRATTNDFVLIHQSQGTGAGQWEVNQLASNMPSSTSTTVNLKYPLAYTYTTGAQIIRIPQLLQSTISGTVGVPWSWGGTFGGILPIMCSGTLTISGNLNVTGSAGSSFTGANSRSGGATGGGFRGGNGYTPNGSGGTANCGEGTSGASAIQYTANGNGGGGAHCDSDWAAGSGGGNGGAGVAGNNANGSESVGGSTAGSANLSTMVFGGGGGGSLKSWSYTTAGGGSGGGIIIIFAKNLVVTGGISTNGGNGGSADVAAAGGAGGSILVKCLTATLGTNKVTATGGSAGSGSQGSPGAGGVGRIAIHHFGAITGTTSPTFTDVQDSSLNTKNYGLMF